MTDKVITDYYLNDEITHLDSRHDEDNDLIPNAPVVTWSDYALLDICKRLLKRIEKLETAISEYGIYIE